MSYSSSIWDKRRRTEEPATESVTYEKPARLPDFSDSNGRLDPDYWGDVIMRMEQENRDEIEKEYQGFHMFIVPEIVQLIFTICVRLEVPHEIRYFSLFIYDEYMRIQINRLYEEIHLSNEDEEKRVGYWKSASLRFYSQSTLRAVSSISLAIKFLYFRLGLFPSLVQRLFAALNHLYDEKSIAKSEHRVFSTVMFSVSVHRNPVTIMETVECALFFTHRELLEFMEPETIWEHAVLFMDFIYMNSEAFYRRLWSALHQDVELDVSLSLERERLWHLEADFVSLALAVISISTHTLYGDELMTKVMHFLSGLTRIKIWSISNFLEEGIYVQ
ncbi:Cyclin N-terminal domain-containing protein [Aphelenchoides bicaudatus]|nr:Cyclin N-terminal domain-containing protein [Aphelenchoides bicaudatus]